MAERRRDDDEERPRRGRDDDERGSRRSRDDDDRGRSRDRDERDDREERGSRRRGDDDEPTGYRYERRDAEDVRKRAQGTNDYDRIVKDHIKQWKPNDGDNRIRILPPTWKGAKHHGVDLKVHYGVGADRQTYLCLHGMLGKDDPIHEAYLRAKAELNEDENNKDLKELVSQLKAKARVGIYLVDRDHPKEGVQFWAMPGGLDMDLVQVMQDKRTGEVLPIDDPEEGYDIEFTKTGKMRNTEYKGIAVARRSSPLGDNKWLKFAMENPIPDQLVYFDYDHIAKAFGGGKVPRREEEETPARGGRDRDRDERGRGREREEEERRPARGRDEDPPRRGRAEDDYDWERIHDMTRSELEDLIEDKRLDIKPKQAKDLDDLADWVCEEMKIKKAPKEERRKPAEEEEGADRMAEMRRRRERD